LELECGWAPGLEAQRAAKKEGTPWEALPSGRDNLVYRAVESLRERAGVEQGATMVLRKRIPAAAGLGGASSDAAAALAAAQAVWGANWQRSASLAEHGEGLGSDVPFFFSAGAAICRGRGELVEPLAAVPAFHFVIVRPDTGLNTADVYRAYQAKHERRGLAETLAALCSGDPARLGRSLHNRLQEPARQLSSHVRRLEDIFRRFDFLGHQLSGSGTSYFGVCRHARHARRLAARLRSLDVGAVYYATTELSPPDYTFGRGPA
jgi:4-diphosphocytidyl-2-C-methyl-D-erythritol kinase